MQQGTHDLHSGCQDHHPSKNSVQKTICCNSTSNAPDDERMYPKTCRAKNTLIKLPCCIKLAISNYFIKGDIKSSGVCNWPCITRGPQAPWIM